MLGKILIGFDLGKLQDDGLRVTPHLAHLLRKAIRLHEIGSMNRAIGNKRTTPVLANHQTKALQLLKGKTHRRAR